jgi:uncharacterized membrane protein YeiB
VSERKTARIRGIDVARAVAILGMVMVHFTLSDPTGTAAGGSPLPDGPRGRAAILFVLLAGVGSTLLDRSRSASRRRTREKLLWRAAILLPLGLALQELNHGVAVILQDYALLFVVAVAAVAWSDRVLLTVAAATYALGPAIYVGAAALWPDAVDRAPTALTDPVGDTVMGLLVTGPYPFVTWTAPLLLGMWLARRDLTDPRVQARILAVATIAALALLWGGVVLESLVPAGAPVWLHLAVDTDPHSQSFVWLLQASAAATAALAACLVVTDAAPRLLTPLVAFGQLALTVYVGHLLLISSNPDFWRVTDVAGAGIRVVGFSIVAAALATAWRSRFERGPLEQALDVPSTLLERRRVRS